MKRLLLLFVAATVQAQTNYYPFRLGSTGTDYGKDLAVDSQGNIILAGYFTGTVDFDPGPATNNLTSAGNVDNFLAKYDSQSKLLWAFRYGSAGVDIPHSVSVDSVGNIYVAGYFSNTCDFDPGPGTANLVSAGGRDVYIAKYSADGNFVWVRGFGASSDDQALDVTVDSAGNVAIVGFFSGTVDVDPGPDVVNLTSTGTTDGFVVKYDPNGNLLWAFRLGSTSGHQNVGITRDADDNLFVSGFFNTTVNFNPLGTPVNLTSAGAQDIFAAKYSASGTNLWAIRAGGTQPDLAIPGGIWLDAATNIHICGNFRGTADFDPGPGTANRTSAGDSDVFVAKYSASGAYVWAVSFGGTLGDNGHRLCVDAAGYVLVTGWYGSTADFDPGAGVYNLTTTGTDGALEPYLAKFDVNGNLAWARGIGCTADGTNSWSLGTCIAPDGLGNFIATGRFFGTGTFGTLGTNTVTLTSAGDADVFVAKFDGAGNLIDPLPTLQITQQGADFVLTWPGRAMLQQTSDLVSNWTDMVTATSPHAITNPASRQLFFRLKR